jgi:hypothetical protein
MSKLLAVALLIAVSSTVHAQEASPPPPAADTPPPEPPAASPPPAPAAPASKVFNPDIAVIGNFVGAFGDNEVDPAPTFDLAESEVSFQAVVDPYARADFFVAFSSEGAEVEEGFITFTSLPGGFLLKAGKLKESIGKVNTLHTHQVQWVDRPLVMENLLGGEEGVADAGLSLSRLFPNSWLFVEATGEVFAGDNEVFQAAERSDVSFVGRLRGYRDLTESTNLDLGVSYAHGSNESFPGATTRLAAVDLTLRWKPLRRAIYRGFLARAELLWSAREQEEGAGEEKALGGYVSADYQVARRWMVGTRIDWAEHADDPELRDTSQSLLLTFRPSEFSLLRAQGRRVSFANGESAHELLLQLQFSIGAHGAHSF